MEIPEISGGDVDEDIHKPGCVHHAVPAQQRHHLVPAEEGLGGGGGGGGIESARGAEEVERVGEGGRGGGGGIEV